MTDKNKYSAQRRRIKSAYEELRRELKDLPSENDYSTQAMRWLNESENLALTAIHDVEKLSRLRT